MRTSSTKGFLKTMVLFVALAGIIMVAISIAGLSILFYYDKPTGKTGPGGITFTVGTGDSGATVARRLAQASIIKSEYLFRVLMKAKHLENSLKAGEYTITDVMGSSDILQLIVEGRQILLRITIPEGASVQTVAQAAEIAGIASASDVLKAVSSKELAANMGVNADSLAGYLFPDTYLLPRNAGGEQLVSIMVSTFKKRVFDAVPESSTLTAAELHQRVILASIVEREYRVAEEAPLMASVFLNRLSIGMALQSCATVVYVISEIQDKPHPSRIFDKDLKIDNPFNTYLHPGLPPEPICNPGLTALQATLRPASTKYLYFRLIDENTGKHYFSSTLDEHIGAASLAVKPRS